MRISGSPPYWPAGTQIMWRYRRIVPGYIGPETVRPMTVVRDDAAGLVAWLAPRTQLLRPVLPDGRELRSVASVEAFRAERAVRRDRWEGTGILKIAPTGPWSVWCFWNDDRSFRGWYVNLEDAHLRDDGGGNGVPCLSNVVTRTRGPRNDQGRGHAQAAARYCAVVT